ncbi:MAG: GntR family transcriptional regulator [Anaerolineae bacterium]|nr:GntR family transcriptional regulator [Anaerolineae bacterium]
MATQQIKVEDLPIRPVNPDSPIPLYHQVDTSLRQMIRSGVLLPGYTLPPELELSRAFAVGRHTMRNALSRLVDDGLIRRKAGRGTVVMQQTDRIQFYLDRSFTRQMADMGRHPRSTVLEAHTGIIDGHAPAPLRRNTGDSYLYLKRLRFGDEEPIGLQETMILTRTCPGLERFDFNRESLYEVLAREYKLLIHEITHRVSAVLADEVLADLLQISAGDPLLIFKTMAHLEGGALIEATTSHYRADRYEYITTDSYTPC